MNKLASQESRIFIHSDSAVRVFFAFALVHGILFEQEWLDVALEDHTSLIGALPRPFSAATSSIEWNPAFHTYKVS